MGIVSAMRCPRCGNDATSPAVFQCGACHCTLEIRVEVGHLTRSDLQAMAQSRDHTIWRWFDFFPIERRASIVSLGGGSSPLIHATRPGGPRNLGRRDLS